LRVFAGFEEYKWDRRKHRRGVVSGNRCVPCIVRSLWGSRHIILKFRIPQGQTPSTTRPPSDQEERTWLRLLFEAQLAAYSRSGDQQLSTGWYFWCWKTECMCHFPCFPRAVHLVSQLIQPLTPILPTSPADRINTWDYRRGVQAGWIPPNVSNTSQLVFPILADGCVDAAFEYTAPAYPNYSRKSARRSPCPIEVLMLVLVVPSLVVGLK